MANCGQHGQNRFGEHAHHPTTPLADLYIGWIPILLVEAMIDQDEHLLFKGTIQGIEGGIINVGRGTMPTCNQSPLVQNVAKLAAHDPTMAREAFFTDLFLTAPFSIGGSQLDLLLT